MRALVLHYPGTWGWTTRKCMYCDELLLSSWVLHHDGDDAGDYFNRRYVCASCPGAWRVTSTGTLIPCAA